jgi:hypothetical protein
MRAGLMSNGGRCNKSAGGWIQGTSATKWDFPAAAEVSDTKARLRRLGIAK